MDSLILYFLCKNGNNGLSHFVFSFIIPLNTSAHFHCQQVRMLQPIPTRPPSYPVTPCLSPSTPLHHLALASSPALRHSTNRMSNSKYQTKCCWNRFHNTP